MMRWPMLLLLSPGVVAASAISADPPLQGVADPARARQNWTLECQGCHRPDGSGSKDTAPAVAGAVATFLQVPGGRDYLARVPGASAAPLPDDQLAELLNWTLQHFDAEHVPADFQPYTPEEVASLRRQPLRLEAAELRQRLMEGIKGRAAPKI